MRALRLLAALLMLATDFAPALAATDPPALGLPYQQSRVPRSKRIAVIQMARWDVQTNNIKLAVIRNVIPALDAFVSNGGEVHRYKSTFFETVNGTANPDHREMWTDMGSKYAAVIVMFPVAVSGTTTSRYICADSTNAQLIVVGGADMGSVSTWVSAPLERGVVDTSGNAVEGVAQTKGCGLVTMDDRDTLWMRKIPTGKRSALPTGIDTVVRILRPIVEQGYSFITNAADSNTYRPVGSWNTAYGADWTAGDLTRAKAGTRADSVAGPGEVLGPMWKVHFTKYSGQDTPSWINSLATTARGVGGGGTSPQSVYWLKVPSNPNPGDEVTPLLWALMCKFTTVNPIRYAYDWDDVTDVNNIALYPRWRQSAADSALAKLRQYGIVPTNMVNPRNAAAYINGLKPDYEIDWSGPAHTYLRNLTWVHHAHDSSQVHISGNLIGGYGGYATGNGANITQGGTPLQKWSHRYASRWNPGANEGGFVGAAGNFGIVQRYNYSDSVRWVNQGGLYPPYVAQPANEMLPVGWRARPTTSNPLWTVKFSGSAECPIDSVIWAHDYGLNGHKTCGFGRVTMRVVAGSPWGTVADDGAGGGCYSDQDRDSMVAASFFRRPGEKRTVRIGDRVIEARAVGSFLQGVGARTAYMQDALPRAGVLLGLRAGGVMAERARVEWGSTYSANLHNAARPGAGSPLASTYAENFNQTSRVCYQHPGQFTTAVGNTLPGGGVSNSSGDLHVEVFVLSIGAYMRGLNTIACRQATKCVPAWTLGDAVQ